MPFSKAKQLWAEARGRDKIEAESGLSSDRRMVFLPPLVASMNRTSVTVLPTLLAALLVAAATLVAQEPAAKPGSAATIEGIVTRDPDSQPVKKALIELIAENQAEAGNYTALTGPDGVFRIENILPGRYHLFAERTGLIDREKLHGRSDGRILTLAQGQELKDLHLRLLAAAVVHGRISDEDGDPMPNAEVTVLRQTYTAGHSHWEQVGADRANDLGEFRVANLPSGEVYVSVAPPPDFKSLIENAGAAAASNHPGNPDPPGLSYQTTYYPGSTDRSQASPVPLHAGDELALNFSLTPAPSLSVRGSVVNLPPRTSASVLLQSREFRLVLNGGEIHGDGSFLIPDVAPGSYTIMATVNGASSPMTARQALQVGSTNVEGVRLSPQAGATVYGHLHLENRGIANSSGREIFLLLEPQEAEQDADLIMIRETFSNLAHVGADGSFQWKDVPPGTYYVEVLEDSTESWFVKSVAAGGRELNDAGIAVSGGTLALDVALSANGGRVEGAVLDGKNQPVPDAVVVAVPDARRRGRVDQYRKTVSDQNGHFSLRGVRPGDYTLFAWESVEGEAYYNPDFLKTFEERGSALHLSEGDQKSVSLTIIADPEERE
jgi:protocatechuate 3,4-dioxygenase beta subunit